MAVHRVGQAIGTRGCGALIAAALIAGSAEASAQELVFGPEVVLGAQAPVQPAILASRVATSPTGALLAWSVGAGAQRWGFSATCDTFVRPLGPEGDPLGPPVRIATEASCAFRAAWAGEAWVVAGSDFAVALSGELDPESLAPSWRRSVDLGHDPVELSPRAEGALMLWLDVDGGAWPVLAGRLLAANGMPRAAFTVAEDWRATVVATPDAEETVVFGDRSGEPVLLWIGADLDEPVRAALSLDLDEWGAPLGVAANEDGGVAVAWDSGSDGIRFAAIAPTGHSKGDGPLRVPDAELASRGSATPAASLVPIAGGFRAFWNGARGGRTRAFDVDGAWSDDAQDVLPHETASRLGGATLLDYRGWVEPVTDDGSPATCSPIPAAAVEHVTPPVDVPEVAWTGRSHALLWRTAVDGEQRDMLTHVAPDGRQGPAADLALDGASCDRIACARPGWCAAACWEEGSDGQGGESGGPAIGWFADDVLVARARTSGPALSDLAWDGTRFLAVAAGNPGRLDWTAGDDTAIDGSLELPRESRHCALGLGPSGAFVGCIATEPSPAWIAELDLEAPGLSVVAELDADWIFELSDNAVIWEQLEDESRRLHWAPFGPGGLDEAAEQILATDVASAVMIADGTDSLVAYARMVLARDGAEPYDVSLHVARVAAGSPPAETTIFPGETLRPGSAAPELALSSSADSVLAAYLVTPASGDPEIRARLVEAGAVPGDDDLECLDDGPAEPDGGVGPGGDAGDDGGTDAGTDSPRRAPMHARGGCAVAAACPPAGAWLWLTAALVVAAGLALNRARPPRATRSPGRPR